MDQLKIVRDLWVFRIEDGDCVYCHVSLPESTWKSVWFYNDMFSRFFSGRCTSIKGFKTATNGHFLSAFTTRQAIPEIQQGLLYVPFQGDFKHMFMFRILFSRWFLLRLINQGETYIYSWKSKWPLYWMERPQNRGQGTMKRRNALPKWPQRSWCRKAWQPNSWTRT